ncbi:MAG: hypothetical protein CMJ78_16040 [Planctomycetaceae bacterium]|nr:hypothetical protein [Planctomycetaceae bacterium]
MGDKSLVWGKNSRSLNTLNERGPGYAFNHLFSSTPTDKLERELQGFGRTRTGTSGGTRLGCSTGAVCEV